MEGCNISFHSAILISGAVATVAYIILGGFTINKSSNKKMPSKKGIIPGLENRGNTCFLNCILQALASCESFMIWLESGIGNIPSPPVLLHSLDIITKVLNCKMGESTASAYKVLEALRSHGWVISTEEQDAHELFHAVTSTLDDEIMLVKKENTSLLNVSWMINEQVNERIFNTSVRKSGTNENSFEKRLIVQTRELQPSVSSSENFQKDVSIISKVSSSLHRNFQDTKRSAYLESPFKGYLASNLQCSICCLKNAEQWSTFESISLSLPQPSWTLQKSSLLELLDAFVRPENVAGVSCDGCSKVNDCPSRTTFSKQLTIGKLPECLCIHIKRTVWLENGCAVKRNDFVDFPEVLNMDPYTYTVSFNHQGGLVGGRQCIQKKSDSPVVSTSDVNESMQKLESCLSSQFKGIGTKRISWKHSSLYKLQAVVVHVGDVFSGHFVTYRRGAINTTMRERWFYTSDTVVKEVNLEEVLQSNAYMLIYERYAF